MKNTLPHIKSEHGFSFPYVLFIVAIIFVTIPVNILIYENEVKLTERYLEQLRIETLFQMANTEIKNEFDQNPQVPNKKIYTFPYGTVTVTSAYNIDNDISVRFDIITKGNSSYTFKANYSP